MVDIRRTDSSPPQPPPPLPRIPARLKSNIVIHDSRDSSIPRLHAQLRRRRICSSDVDHGCSSTKKWWLAVRGFPMGFHTLAEGDLIKIGRSKFTVRQLVTESEAVGPVQACNSSLASHCTPVRDSETKTCRICLAEGSDID